jgi:SAM-dependent methyltransferase
MRQHGSFSTARWRLPVPDFASDYDAIAEYYQNAWAGWFLPSLLPALERLFFSAVPPQGRLLDACCGCGHITKELVARGYAVTGLDNSKELIARAAKALPSAEFVVADVREFRLPPGFDGALCTFDSLNHLLTYADLVAALRAIRVALRPDSPFFFDMNLEEAYSLDLGRWADHREENALGFVRGVYDLSSKRATTELIWFFRDGPNELWQRRDARVEEQCYSREQIESALAEAGFSRCEYYTPSGAGIADDLGFGRIYVRAWA